MKSIDKIKEQLEVLEVELPRLEERGIKVSATRIRKALLEISKLCKLGRQEALDIKNSI